MADSGRWKWGLGWGMLWLLVLASLGFAQPATAGDQTPATDPAALRAELDEARRAGDVSREADAWRALGRLQQKADDHRASVESFEEALVLRRSLGGASDLADALHDAATAHGYVGEHGAALDLLAEALDLHRRLDEPATRADVRNSYCLALQKLGRFRDAAPCYEETLDLARFLGDRELEGRLLNNLGGISANLGEPDRHFEYLHAALELRRSLRDEFGVGATLNNLGSLHRRFGEVDEAVLCLTEALDIFERLDNRYWLARTLNNLGYTYLDVGEPERARTILLRAIPIRREVGDRAGEAVTLRNLGRAFGALGDDGKALAFYRKALEIAESRDDRRGVVSARKLLGGYLVQRRPWEARRELELALGDARRMENRHEQAEILVLMGRAHLATGVAEELAGAAAAGREALDLLRAVRDPLGEVAALSLLARVATRRAAPEQALHHLDAARAALDQVDRGLGEASRRATFLASWRAVYELQVDVLMARHRLDPEAGHHRRALEVSEAARSRRLLAWLAGSAENDPELREAERRLAAKIQRLIRVLGSPHGSDDANEAEAERVEALTELEAARARLRRAKPDDPAFAVLPELDADGMHRLLDAERDAGSVLVEFLLGEESSWGWWVTGDDIVSFPLPPRAEIEDLARRAHADLSVPGQPSSGEHLSALGRLLLGPVAERLGSRRLAVVADGALHLVPFAALGDPRSPEGVYEPLLLRHEVVHLPSATALAEQRAARRRPAQPDRTLAILADPIFSPTDPRLPAQTAAPAGVRDQPPAVEATRDGELVRLEESRAEAEAIAALVNEPAARLLAIGADARRSLVLDGILDDYRILHFATHGIVHPGAPDLSGLVLSRFDMAGRAIDGFLGLQDVSRLDLAAELVVLSGCHTALGKHIRGEGLVGLARGFMYAGAPRVLATHWQVRDRATAELMTRFYDLLLSDGHSAAAALRASQLEVRELRRYRDPYFWAAFSLQGDWR